MAVGWRERLGGLVDALAVGVAGWFAWLGIEAAVDGKRGLALFGILCGLAVGLSSGWRLARILRRKPSEPESRHYALVVALLFGVLGGFGVYDAVSGGIADAVVGGVGALLLLPSAVAVIYVWHNLRGGE